MNDRKMKLGVMIHGVGHGTGEWRHPDALADASVNIGHYKRQAKLAESAKFDFVFIADSLFIHERSSPHFLNRLEPLTVLSALSAVTERIGLVATITVSYTEPYQVARQLGSLDHISGGRAGWNVVTSWLSGTAQNFGKHAHPPHNVRYQIAREHVDVVKGLWDSWEDGAFTRNKLTGQFFDPKKLHVLNHSGHYFKVKGPLNLARSRQGHPVIFQAGTSPEGRAFAAEYADAIFNGYDKYEDVAKYYQDIKALAVSHGRDPESISVLQGIRPIIGLDREEAEKRYQVAASLVSIEDALIALGRPFNDYDFSGHDLDAPFPDLRSIGAESQQGTAEKISQLASNEGLTLREVAMRLSLPDRTFTGTPVEVADQMQNWFDNRAADGFIIIPILPDGLEYFTEHVVPILQSRDLVRTEYRGETLRAHFNLAVPKNRFTAVQ